MAQIQAIRIGTRGSRLALWQANAVRDALVAVGTPADAIEIVAIRTSGDRIQDRPLAEVGGKGLFTKEIEAALLAGAIDLAVHSAKDMETALPPGLKIGAVLPRADARDVLVASKAASLEALPPGARLGTCSLRREALARRARPDIAVELLRGNVPTRLKRVAEGHLDATLLAAAGLQRLGLQDRITAYLPLDAFPPSCGQGVVAIECREGDARMLSLLAAVDHRETAAALACERAFLAALDGSCRTPVAGHARIADGVLTFAGIILSPDGAKATTRVGRGARPRPPRSAMPRAATSGAARRAPSWKNSASRREADRHQATAAGRPHGGEAGGARPWADPLADARHRASDRRAAAGAAGAGRPRHERQRRRRARGASFRAAPEGAAAVRRRRPDGTGGAAGRLRQCPLGPRRFRRLAALAIATLDPSAGPLLHAAGEDQAHGLAGPLASAGFETLTAILYRAVARERLSEAARDALRSGQADGVLLYSRRSAEAFAGAVRVDRLAPLPAAVTCYCLSDAVAEPIAAIGSTWAVADAPDEARLFALLEAPDPGDAPAGLRRGLASPAASRD